MDHIYQGTTLLQEQAIFFWDFTHSSRCHRRSKNLLKIPLLIWEATIYTAHRCHPLSHFCWDSSISWLVLVLYGYEWDGIYGNECHLKEFLQGIRMLHQLNLDQWIHVEPHVRHAMQTALSAKWSFIIQLMQIYDKEVGCPPRPEHLQLMHWLSNVARYYKQWCVSYFIIVLHSSLCPWLLKRHKSDLLLLGDETLFGRDECIGLNVEVCDSRRQGAEGG